MLKLKRYAILVTAGVALAAAVANACDTPVYQYALERWQAHAIPVVIFHRGPLTGDDAVAAKLLRDAGENAEANIELHTVDLDKPLADYHRSFWEKNATDALPHLFLLSAPRSAGPVVIDHWPLSPAAAAAVLESPARNEIAKRILESDSAVWVLVTDGDPAVNDAAEALLKRELPRIPKLIEEAAANSPDFQQLPAAPGEASVVTAEPRPLKFSVLRVSRKDPAERILIEMLMRVEPGLTDAKYQGKPMVFPVFGRGRALSALVGGGITLDNILRECAFLTGPCVCEIKDQNPGVDLLFAAPWDNAIAGAQAVQFVLPPLSGSNTTAPPEQTPDPAASDKTVAAAPVQPDDIAPRDSGEVVAAGGMSTLMIALLAAGGLVLLGVIGVSIAIANKSKTVG